MLAYCAQNVSIHPRFHTTAAQCDFQHDYEHLYQQIYTQWLCVLLADHVCKGLYLVVNITLFVDESLYF